MGKKTGDIQGCDGCNDKDTELKSMRWAYGVTTVPKRRNTLLPRTLESLRAGGFDKPRLFVDGDKDTLSWEAEFKLDVTARYPNIRTFGNWVLSMWELYARNPDADRYALFQDDMVTYRNLRSYLERQNYPEKAYLNLYTFPRNMRCFPAIGQTGRRNQGWYMSNQRGLGAVGLVFSRTAVCTLLASLHMVLRPQDPRRGWRAVDGGVVESMKKAGWREYVHNPSLVQHTGTVSSMGNGPHAHAENFLGEDFDALELLDASVIAGG